MAPLLFCSPTLSLGLLLLVATTAQPLHQICPENAGNYTANSTFRSNLDRLLSSLAADGSPTGFLNDTAGNQPDAAYGLVLCRGDVAAGDCRACLDEAARDLVRNSCPGKRSAVVWYDNCMLRYSDRRFFAVPDNSLRFRMWNTENLKEVTQFDRQRDRMMAGLVRYAAYNASARMFATGEAGYGDPNNPKIYGLVQCTRDQSAGDCNACLTGIVGEIPRLFPSSSGARIIKATCNFRYELYPFYNSSVMVSIPLQTNGTLAPPADEAQGKKKNPTGVILATAIPLGVALLLISVICACFRRKKAQDQHLYVPHSEEITAIESLLFDLPTLRAATDNFSDQNRLGQGGFGSVYKGVLLHGQEIAVKRLSAGSGQGVQELKNEVALLAKLQHRNLVRLLGLCLEGEEKLLVYEYVPNRSLDKFLFDGTRNQELSWERRYKIIGGIARGTQYLHEESQLKIIHRDLKASNILLDADMNPKISDFGLARLFDGDQTQASTTRVVGTYGYMAPEYAMRGHFSNKSDVFSFGVLVLEIVTGQKNSDYTGYGNSIDLPSWIWEQWRNGTVLDTADHTLDGQYNRSELMRCIQIGLLCVQEVPADRPTMSSVVLMLRSHTMSLQVPSRPAFFIGYSHAEPNLPKKNLDSSASTVHGDSATKSVLYSPNEMSITDVLPR